MANENNKKTDESKQKTREVDVYIQPTPNPNALKFVTSEPVKNGGNSTYLSPLQCGDNNLALTIFNVRGIDQLHFFENVITITKFGYEEWENIENELINIIKRDLPDHNPDYFEPDPEADRRAALSDELKEIEAILDRTIRPGLQGDGGDIATISYDDNILVVQYQGACGTCPSSTTGTLQAIKGILQDEYNPDIEVYIAPAF